MELASVLQAIKRADAAGDTEAAQKLGAVARQMMSSPEDLIKQDYSMGEILSKGVQRGVKRLGSTFGDIVPAMGASALGFDEYARKQMEEAAQTEQEIARTMPAQYKSLSDVKGIGDYLPFALETIGEQVPNIATSLVPGVGAAGLATRAGLGMAGKAAAVNAGTFLGAYAQNAPEVFQNIYQETGQLAPGASAIFGAGAAALDSVLPASLAKRLTGPVKMGIVEKMLEKSGMDKGLLRTVTANAIKGVPGEGLTEGAQEAISIAAENFVAKNPQIFESKEWNRIMESAVRGAVAGGAFGGAGGVAERAQVVAERQRRYDAVMADRNATLADRRRAKEELLAAQEAQKAADTEAILAGEAEQTELAALQDRQYTPPVDQTEVARTAAAENQAAINRARQEEKRQAAALKADQATLKKAIGELTDVPTDLLALAKQPSPLAQTIAQTREEMDALAAKRGPKPVVEPETPVSATETTVKETSAQPTTTSVEEPKIRKAATPSLESITKIDDPKVFGKLIGVGPTARILRADGPLAGKDLTDPAQAAEVKSILEAYASGKPAVGAAEKIDAFLKRPEFQGATDVARPVEQSTGAGAVVPSEPAAGAAAVAEGTEPSGMVSPREVVGDVAVREGEQPGALTEATPAEPAELGKKAKTDLAKAEAGTETALKEQATFAQEVDQRTDDLLTEQLRATAREAGLSDADVPSESHAGTDAHNTLRLPPLINEFFRLQDVSRQEGNDPAQQRKNQQEMQAIKDAIAKSGMDPDEALAILGRSTPEQRDTFLSEMSRQARNNFEREARQRVAKIKEEKAAAPQAEKPTKREVSEDEIFETLTGVLNKGKVPTALGRKLFNPAYQGPAFNQADADLANKGDFNGLLRSMLNQIKDPAIKQVLRKLRSLNLNVKIEIGPVEGGQAGSYDPATNTITLDPRNGMNAHTFVHEAIHAAVSHVLNNSNHPLTKDFQKFFVQIQDRLGAAYGAKDLQEFAAELVGNPQFQAALKAIKTPRSESMFRYVMRRIAEFLGFTPKTSAFDTGLDFVERALDISADVEPTGAEKLFMIGGQGALGQVADIARDMPAATKQTIEDAKNAFSNLKDGRFKEAAFGLLRLDNLRDMYGSALPAIQKILDALELRAGMQEKKIGAANRNYRHFVRVARQHPQAMKRLNDIAVNARLEEVDLLDPKFQPTAQNQAAYSRLKQEFNALPADVRQVYATIRNEYDASFREYKQLLTDAAQRAHPALAAKLAQMFQTQKPVVGYIPFLRHGNYWVEYTDPTTGEPAASAFESSRERQQFVDSMPKGTQHRLYQNVEDARFTGDNLPPTHFIMQVMQQLKQQGASQEQLDGVYQAYLSTFPAESLMKQFMKSQNKLGMERDIIRGYSDLMVRYARKLANSKYVPEIDRALAELKEEARVSGDDTLRAVAENVLGQSAFFHNPNFGTLVHAGTALSYFEFIAGNISSALVNLTSLPMMVYPLLTGKFGWGNTTAAMTSALKTAHNNWGQMPKYKKLYDTLMDHGQLEHTTAREVLEGRRQSTDQFTSVKARVMELLSKPFTASERYNRGVTAIAAYDLAMQQGMGEAQAIRYALNTVKDAHTSGMAATGPKWMQTPLGRMFFTFKSFAWNSAYVMARAFHQAAKGETPEVKRAARHQLLATYGMATVFAGVKGMPFYGAISTFFTMMAALMGDDDEPFDFDEFLRNSFGEMAYKGLINYGMNVEVSNRSGIATDLIFRDDPRGVAEHGYVLSAMQQILGPLGSIAVNSGNAIKMFKDGHIERALETAAPSFFRNGMKGMRYLVEGATTLKGDPVMEDIGAYNSMMQMIGFTPADLSSQYERVQAAKGFEREVQGRRTQILQMYDMAHTAGDSDLLQEANERRMSFNEHHPKFKIDQNSIERSIKARKAAEKDMIHGVRFNKKLRAEIVDKFFDEED